MSGPAEAPLAFDWDPPLPPLGCAGGGDCRYPDPGNCSTCMVTLDELLWALFGWLWLAGGCSELDTWAPDETRIAGVDYDELDELECPLCGCWLGTCDCYLDEGGV